MDSLANIVDLLPVAIEAAEAACTEILDVYNSGNFQIEYKEDASPLTLADKRAHKKIVDVLTNHNALPILSEEGSDTDYSVRGKWKYFWMIDPLDGTKEFINKSGEFTVNIALIVNSVPVLGVVAVPVTGEVYYGASDIGAFVKAKGWIKTLPKRSTHADLKQEGLRVVASRNHMNKDTQQFIDSLKNPELTTAGSSLKFMLLATNKADVYPRFGPTMEWDTAAAHAIARAVGIDVLEVDTLKELSYNKPSLVNPNFISH